MGRRRKEQAPTSAGLEGKSLSQEAAEAAALGLTYGQYTALVETGALEAWKRNNTQERGKKRCKQDVCG